MNLPYFITVRNTVGIEEDVMIGKINRVQPLTEGETKQWGVNGCRLYMEGEVSSIMVHESREEVWAKVHAALGGPDEHADVPNVSITQVIEALGAMEKHAVAANQMATLIGSLRHKAVGGPAQLPVFGKATAEELAEMERLAIELSKPLPEIQYGVDLTDADGSFSISEVPVVELWRHKKRQSLYGVLTMEGSVQGSIDEGDHVTIYVDQEGHFWVRDRAEFLDGRFVKEQT